MLFERPSASTIVWPSTGGARAARLAGLAFLLGSACSSPPTGSGGEADIALFLPDVAKPDSADSATVDAAQPSATDAAAATDAAIGTDAAGQSDVAGLTDATAQTDASSAPDAAAETDAAEPKDWGNYFDDDDAEPDVAQFPDCAAGTILCKGAVAQVCDGTGGLAATELCPGWCLAGVGCVTCKPGSTKCDATSASVCSADGTQWLPGSCDPELGLSCNEASGQCVGPCSAAAAERSYIGCEYWPVVTSNAGLYTGFSFAVAIASASDQPATVVIYKGSQKVATTTVQPGGVATVQLPWVSALKQSLAGANSKATYDGSFTSKLVADGAYHLKSTAPVTVSQFNPLQFEVPAKADCDDNFDTGQCLSYTNDAAMLLPTTALGKDHYALSWPAGASWNLTYKRLSSPGFVSVVATKDGTQVTVQAAGKVRSGAGVQAMDAGTSQTFALNAGDVLQVLTAVPPDPTSTLGCANVSASTKLCPPPAGYDLSGSWISASEPIAVVGGHDCATVPANKMACDHIEESIPPLNTWGKSVVVAAPQAVTGAATANGKADVQLVRIVSGADNNTLTFDPPIAAVGVPVLSKGQVLELPLGNGSYHISATGPILVGQYMAGGDQVDPLNSGTINSKGDPSFGMAVPISQYRKDYVFLIPDSYTYNFVSVIAPKDAVLALDGQPVTATFAPIGSSGYGVARIKVKGGNHTITGDVGFGLLVYGYAAYTSYMYPGGLNLAL